MPSHGSIKFPLVSQYIAFIVKSLLSASKFKSSVNFTVAYLPSVSRSCLIDVTSNDAFLMCAVIDPYFNPAFEIFIFFCSSAFTIKFIGKSHTKSECVVRLFFNIKSLTFPPIKNNSPLQFFNAF